MKTIVNQKSEDTIAQPPELDVSFNLLEIISAVWKWRKMILILMLVVTLGSIIISLLMPNYYTATATIMPANEDKDLFGNDTKNNGLYGDEDAVDRTIIFANSTELVNYMIREYHLAKRYRINTSTPKGESKVAKRFRKLYNVKKNEYSGIELSMQDTDPDSSAVMLTDAIHKLERLYKDATAINKSGYLKTYESTLADKRKELASMRDSLVSLRRRYNIFDVEKQGEYLASTLVSTQTQLAESQAKLNAFLRSGGRRDSIIVLTARVEGLKSKLALLNSQSDSLNGSMSLKTYNEGKEKVLFYETQIERLNEDIGETNVNYSQFKTQAKTKANSIIVLEPVQIPKVKSSPVRSLIVIAAAVLAFILGLLAALVLELNKRVDWKQVFAKEEV